MNQAMQTLQLAGRLIVENGGEIFRVEETITRMGRALGLKDVESFSVPSGVFISFTLPDGASESSVARVRGASTNLDRVDRVNDISRRIEAGQLDCAEALRELQAIERRPGLSPVILVPAAGVCAAGFTAMFGGNLREMLPAFVAGSLVQLLSSVLDHYRLRSPVSLLTCGFVSTIIPLLFTLLWPTIALEAIVGGALMPMLPGLAMTNAVQDTMRGDLMSGLSHGIQALLTAALIAVGAAAGTALWAVLGKGGLL